MIARDKTSLVGRAREAKVEIAVFYDTPVQPLEGLALRDVLYEPGSCPRAEQLSAIQRHEGLDRQCRRTDGGRPRR
jgi:hypothetical protein